jgi:hypothetical protein
MVGRQVGLRDILDNRRWLLSRDPFPHFTAQDVFVKNFYEELEAGFRDALAKGLTSNCGEKRRFANSIKGYAATALSFDPNLSGPFRIFISRAWRDLLANLTGVNATGDVNGGFHHHGVGSVSGSVHNDFNPGWFVDRHNAAGINVSDFDLCDYQSGRTREPNLVGRLTVRAVAMLFYLNNHPWYAGDGGETGLYRSAFDPIEEPTAIIPPLNNSILVFECTPYSYHCFKTNRRSARNCVIIWLHRPIGDAISRWGEASIVQWP